MNKKYLVFSLVVLVVIAVFASTKFRKTRTPEEVIKREINVKASGGKFEPGEIELMNLETITLSINAIDDDYVFVLEEFGINTQVPKGKTTEVKVEGLGVGTYTYSCGEGCSGEIIVTPDVDVEFEL